MSQRRPPVSNTERQRQFRERNPGYYRRLHAKRRGATERHCAEVLVKFYAVVRAERAAMTTNSTAGVADDAGEASVLGVESEWAPVGLA